MTYMELFTELQAMEGYRVYGVLAMAVQFCEQSINHLRIDTHNDNKIMQHVIEKNGFKRCGIIHVNDGSERIAYEKQV